MTQALDDRVFPPVILEGRSTRLEPFSVTHARLLLRAATGPRESYAYTTVPATEPEMVEYIAQALSEQVAEEMSSG